MISAREIYKKLLVKDNLSSEESEQLFDLLMKGRIGPALSAGILTALRMKEETDIEIYGAAVSMRNHCQNIDVGIDALLDTCGTGGDESNTFNISTVAALVLAAGGAAVAKHGNRSVSSKCGSADVLENLGIPIDLTPANVCDSIRENNFGFLFAPYYHPSMKNIAPVRRDLGVRTIFNLLGPLTNPANAKYQIIGVINPTLVEKMASVLAKLGCRRGFVFSSEDGLDEISPAAKTRISEINNGKVTKTYWFYPEDEGFKLISLNDIAGGDINENALLAEKILKGEAPKAEMAVLLNAAFGFMAIGKADNVREGIEIGRDVIKSGKAADILERLRSLKK